MITVHHLNNSRSQRILWMLEEIGVEYEIVQHQRDPLTNLAPQSLKAVHALGKSPILVDNELVVPESGAIIEYLAKTYAADSLLPKANPDDENQYSYWMHFAEGSLMPPMVMRLVMERVKTSPKPFFARGIANSIANKVLSNFVLPNFDRNLDYINTYLEGKKWFAGDHMTGADIQMSFPLEAVVATGRAEAYPNIQAFVKRVHERPAYQRALEKGGEYAYG
jgi:glutathione S-transferase